MRCQAPDPAPDGKSSKAWLEQVDPATLETLDRSPDLPSAGDWVWCGANVAHENGDIYTVNGP